MNYNETYVVVVLTNTGIIIQINNSLANYLLLHLGIDPSSDNLQNPPLVDCAAPDPLSSSWYIQRYGTGADSLDGTGARLTLNDSFSFNSFRGGLNIRNVTKFSEGTYRCGLNTSASLCLFVRGKHFDEVTGIPIVIPMVEQI